MLHRLGLAVLVFSLTAVSHATTITFTGQLSGANENPATTSSGTGTATVTLNTVAHTLDVNVVFSNLLSFTSTGAASATTAAHIHCCVAPPGNAGVATTVPAFPGFPLGVTSGTYTGTLDLLSSASYNPAFITANGGTAASADAVLENGFINGQTYLNIHTNAFPGGEIRAFLTPEPATSLLALSAAALFLIRRRFSS